MKDRLFQIRPMCVLALGIALCATAVAQDKPSAKGANKASEETWDVIYLGKSRAGYEHTLVRTVNRNGRDLIRTETQSHLVIKRFGQPLTMQVSQSSEETKQGKLIRFKYRSSNPPLVIEGRVDGDRLKLTTTQAGKTTEKTIKWDPAAKSSAYLDRAIREKPLKPGSKRSFKTYDAQLNGFATTTIVAHDFETVEILGKKHKLLKAAVSQSYVPQLVTYMFLDKEGNALKSTVDFSGVQMVTVRVPRKVALKELSDAEFDLGVATLVKVKPIRRAHRTTRIVYRVTMEDEDPSKLFPKGPTQQVKKIGPHTAALTVTRLRPGKTPASPVTAGKQFTGPTPFLQSTNARVVRHARKATSGKSTAWDKARAMELYVFQNLKNKNFSTALATAAEVAEHLEGDCTEHAVLLAAMARAQKIPSRIAVGLVYNGASAFGGHMWAEVLVDGQWIPVDATLGLGGIGAAHIKLADSSFAEDAPTPIATFFPILRVLGKLKIEVVEKHYE